MNVPLNAYGFTAAQIDALYVLWDSEHIEPLITVDAQIVRGFGFDPAVTYDAVAHQLDGYDAVSFLRNGFTPHQAHTIEHTPRARTTLHAQGPNGMDDFLAADAPRDFLINVLLVALNHDEAQVYLDRFRTARRDNPDADPNAVEAEVTMLAGLPGDHNTPAWPCNCGQSTP